MGNNVERKSGKDSSVQELEWHDVVCKPRKHGLHLVCFRLVGYL